MLRHNCLTGIKFAPFCVLPCAPVAPASRPRVPMQNAPFIRHTRKRTTKAMASDARPTSCSEEMRNHPGWLISPANYLVACLGPNILAMTFSKQVLALEQWQIALLMCGLDLLFTAGSFLFLRRLHEIDVAWHGQSKRYPAFCAMVKREVVLIGPWRDMGAQQKICKPFQFLNYVKVFFWTGLIIPLAVLCYSLLTPYSAVAACVIPPYVITLVTQLVQERQVFQKGSATWVAVPLHHQVYRFLQCARGLYLVAALQGPNWLTYLLVYILALWTFNYGSLMTWLTSMYYWHMQPEET